MIKFIIDFGCGVHTYLYFIYRKSAPIMVCIWENCARWQSLITKYVSYFCSFRLIAFLQSISKLCKEVFEFILLEWASNVILDSWNYVFFPVFNEWALISFRNRISQNLIIRRLWPLICIYFFLYRSRATFLLKCGQLQIFLNKWLLR